MRWKGFGYTDIGLERQQNEDAFYVDNRSHIFIVSDGMGGVDGGEVASKLIVTHLPVRIKKLLKKYSSIESVDLHQHIKDECIAVNDLIRVEAKEQQFPGMGATLVMAVIRKNKALIVNVGDSRGYLFRDRTLQLITEDHATAEGLLTHVMGADSLTRVDIQCIHLQTQDQLLLCSDGLSHMISDTSIESTVQQSSFSKAGLDLIKTAIDAGGEDNITVIHIIKSK